MFCLGFFCCYFVLISNFFQFFFNFFLVSTSFNGLGKNNLATCKNDLREVLVAAVKLNFIKKFFVWGQILNINQVVKF